MLIRKTVSLIISGSQQHCGFITAVVLGALEAVCPDFFRKKFLPDLFESQRNKECRSHSESKKFPIISAGVLHSVDKKSNDRSADPLFLHGWIDHQTADLVKFISEVAGSSAAADISIKFSHDKIGYVIEDILLTAPQNDLFVGIRLEQRENGWNIPRYGWTD